MAYTTPEAVQFVLARDLDQYDSTAASLETGQLEDAIRSAQAEVDARLAMQYKVPFNAFPNSPPLVAEITRDIAAFLADLTYRQDVDYTSDNEPMLLRWRRAQGLLEMLVLGTITLTGAETNPTEPVERPASTTTVHNKYQGELFGLSDFDLGWERRGYPEYWPRTDY
jgi:phage gp36-like protein